ncbi:DUF934 domain-containing protein [Arenibaculum sp.]|jgi:uncharacterized protein (DUF934 family)|uniref:DUF934 domain-containing protein n=1 Tax=Arenibaculum sp. TaxID=2865862 RepID=UPI002E157163|nr:DUF934 domain-containing protein [Arenibaculum sp.]
MALLDQQGRPVPDAWHTVADGAPVPADRPAIVPLSRLAAERDDLAARTAPLGVKLGTGELAEHVAPYLGLVSLVAVEFAKFRDGRGFSTARELRERHGFAGEIRALGHTLPDQYRFLLRCGFTTVAIPDDRDAAAWTAALGRIAIAYQRAADEAAPVSLLRRRLAGVGVS